MPITMLNVTQTEELIDALKDGIAVCKTQQRDASIISIGTNNWVALDTEASEYYDETLVRVCYSESDVSDGKHTWGTAYKNSVTKEIVYLDKNKSE